MNPITPLKQLIGLAVWLLLCFFAAGIGAAASVQAGAFYGQLIRPDWAPPGWVFGPVWTTLYVLIGVSAWRVWRVGGFRRDRIALGVLALQWVLNFAWSGFFFGLRSPGAALVEIVLLLALIGALIARFARIDRLAAALLVPYAAWVAFATALNAALWWLNR